jgi:subtilisin
MAPDAEIIDYRIFKENGKQSEDLTLVKAIDQAVADGCHIINMSVASGENDELKASVEAAHKVGIIMVAASGNYGDLDVTTNEIS